MNEDKISSLEKKISPSSRPLMQGLIKHIPDEIMLRTILGYLTTEKRDAIKYGNRSGKSSLKFKVANKEFTRGNLEKRLDILPQSLEDLIEQVNIHRILCHRAINQTSSGKKRTIDERRFVKGYIRLDKKAANASKTRSLILRQLKAISNKTEFAKLRD
ncbi:hypothetical protein HY989_00270 [Candidatus Micrarchaeota archaeon]|nr:hypothetical protein [Candidatus Micrarchaeota archaeon]